MPNNITVNTESNIPVNQSISMDVGPKEDIPGIITNTIGSGKYAQASIVWQVIKWSFIAAGVITLFCIVQTWCQGKPVNIEELKTIWSIFMPLITLALGYLFGKRD